MFNVSIVQCFRFEALLFSISVFNKINKWRRMPIFAYHVKIVEE